MRVTAILLTIALALPAHAVSRRRIAAINIGATSLFTFLGCVVQGRLQQRPLTRGGAARCFAAGGAAGAVFYQAKRFVAHGDITTGWLIANAASSVVENTTAGEHPLSRLGYTFGPFRLRVVTPFDRLRESYLDIDVSAVEAGYLARALDADDVDVRNGMIWFETDQPITEGDVVFHGYTWGIVPGVWSGADQTTSNHEAVHAVQSLQLDSVDPPLLTFHRKPRPVRLRYIRAGALNLADNVLNAGALDYEQRWAEIEAFRLSEDVKPPE
jgi:hypothetical protein